MIHVTAPLGSIIRLFDQLRVPESSVPGFLTKHYSDVIMSTMATQISILSIVYSTICSSADQRNIKAPLRVTGLCEKNSPVTGEFPAQKASNSENVFIS